MTERPLFDRSVPKSLLEILKSGGKFAGLPARVTQRRGDPLDLHLRCSPKEPNVGWATLYVGLTKAFDFFGREDGKIRVEPHPRHGPHDEARRAGWTVWQKPERLPADKFLRWADEMIDAALKESRSKVEHEGALQARVARGERDWFCAIDRETMFAFSDKVTKQNQLDRIRKPLKGVVDRVRGNQDWTGKSSGGTFAGKLDILGVDNHGRVLVIEVKPGLGNTGTLAWTPYQVAQYMAQCRAWLKGESEAASILNRMLRQREALGLVDKGRWEVKRQVVFVPVIAVGLRVRSKQVDERMTLVEREVRRAQPALVEGLEIWGVEQGLDGRIGPLKLGSLRDATVSAAR
jgi:hypothetical protein